MGLWDRPGLETWASNYEKLDVDPGHGVSSPTLVFAQTRVTLTMR